MTQTKRLLLKILQQQDRSRGFSLLEVLAGMLVLSTFIATSMTAMVASVTMEERARTSSEATSWIEQDLELVKNHATTVTYRLAASANAGQRQIVMANSYGLVAGERIAIAGDSTIYIIQSVSGNTINLSSNLFLAAAPGREVIPITKCQATAATLGLGEVLKQSLPPVANSQPASPNSATRTVGNRTFTLARQVSVSTAAPHQVLQLTYTVTPQGSRQSIATMYTEVIPNAAFQCPSA